MATPTNLPASFTVGQVLTAAQMNNLRGAFRILQVVSASTSTVVLTTSTTFADTTLTCSITPQSSTSKILILGAQSFYLDGGNTGLGVRLLRGSTILQEWDSPVYGFNTGIVGDKNYSYLDSPNTSSSVTYKTTFSRRAGTANIYTQINNNPGNLILCEVSA